MRFQPSIRRPRALGTSLQGLPGAHAPKGRVLCLLLAEPRVGPLPAPYPSVALGWPSVFSRCETGMAIFD